MPEWPQQGLKGETEGLGSGRAGTALPLCFVEEPSHDSWADTEQAIYRKHKDSPVGDITTVEGGGAPVRAGLT